MAKGLCKACYHRDWKRADPLRGRRNHLLVTHGLTLTQFEQMESESGGACEICKLPNPNGRRLSVDHDHVSGRIRGLLCGSCKFGVGPV